MDRSHETETTNGTNRLSPELEDDLRRFYRARYGPDAAPGAVWAALAARHRRGARWWRRWWHLAIVRGDAGPAAPTTSAPEVLPASGRLLAARHALLRPAAALLICAVLFVAFGAGAVVAAQDALPGEPMYVVKTAVREVQVALTVGAEARQRLRKRFEEEGLVDRERAYERERHKQAQGSSGRSVGGDSRRADHTRTPGARASAADEDAMDAGGLEAPPP